MADHAKLNGSGNWLFMGSQSPGWVSNLGLESATTTNAADSIKITGGDGSDLSSTNPLKVTVTNTTTGILSMFSATANVTLNLTGATFGMDGDISDGILFVYAINDTAALKWGVASDPRFTTIADTSTSATATSVTTSAKMFVNSALNSGTWPCQRVGWFKVNYDHTGGAAEKLYAVQTGTGDMHVGTYVPPNIAVYDLTAGTANSQIASGGTAEALDFDTLVYDPLTSVTTGASWVFVAKYTCLFAGAAKVLFDGNANYTIGDKVELQWMVDDVFDEIGARYHYSNTESGSGGGSVDPFLVSGTAFPLGIGQTLNLEASTTATTNLATSAGNNRIFIHPIGLI